MPEMYEIYDHHAREYDELVNAEDHEGNLLPALLEVAVWDGADVVEAGTGTGRVTALFAERAARIVCFDRSSHMLEAAQKNLTNYAGRITFAEGNNMELPLQVVTDAFGGSTDTPALADILVEGWAYGHAVMDSGKPAATCRRLINSSRRLLKEHGTIIIMETLGTAVDAAGAPHPLLEAFYLELEDAYGFSRREIQTDYRFTSLEEAERVMGFFFGDSMAAEVRRRGTPIIPEWTGLWWRRY